MIKLILYLVVIPLCIYAVDSVNLNGIFKKNKISQAKVFYILMVFCLSYLITSFLYDFLYTLK